MADPTEPTTRPSRRDELEVLAAIAPQPWRSLLLAAIEALKAGALDEAARISSVRLMARPENRWPCFLLALESAELRLGGSVAIGTPAARWKVDAGGVHECWSGFGLTPALEEEWVGLVIEHEHGVLCAKPTPRTPAATHAVLAVARELSAFWGTTVKAKRAA